MVRLLLAAAALGLGLSAAYAECAGHQSVQASEPAAATVVASNAADAQAPADTTAKPLDEAAAQTAE